MALKDKLEQINKLKLELDALQPISVENESRFWKKIRLDWNYNSNHIEGNTLTYGETQLLLFFDKTVGDHELREYEEMKAHDAAIHMVKDWAKDKERDLNENNIRELNKIILVKPYWKPAITHDGQATQRQIKVGEYKEQPNSVIKKNGEIFEYASPLETPQKMAELMEMYRKNSIKDAIVTASQLHYSFIRIHPFDDGNGRVARLLVNYVLMKNNYPPIVIKSSEKEKYLTALNKADVGDLDAFHEYMAEQLINSLEMAIKAGKGESIEDDDDYIKEISLLKQKTQTAKLSKSPGLVYDVFQAVQKKVWYKIVNTLENFNELFNESKTTHLINKHFDEKYDTYNVLASPFTKSSKPAEKKIFGHDVYELDIQVVEWNHVKFGLKGGKAGNKYQIDFRIEFSSYDYAIKINLNHKELYKCTKTYNDLLFVTETEEMNTILKTALLSEIKKNVDEQK